VPDGGDTERGGTLQGRLGQVNEPVRPRVAVGDGLLPVGRDGLLPVGRDGLLPVGVVGHVTTSGCGWGYDRSITPLVIERQNLSQSRPNHEI